jgi:N-acetylmuramoyl-L-alanine amidase
MLTEGGRSQRRARQRAQRRRRRILLLGAIILAAASVTAIALLSRSDRGSATESASTPRTLAATTLARASGPESTTVAGTKRNEPAAETAKIAPGGETARAPLAALRGRVIVIDPGHNGQNYAHSIEINRLVSAGTIRKACDTTGTETNDGYTEAAYTFDVSLRLAALLRRGGARVILTRKTNDGWGPCITERAAIGNRAHADAAVSIHADGGPAGGRGFHVIYPPSITGLTDDIAVRSRQLAVAVRTAYRAGTGMPYATYIGTSGLDLRSDLGGLNLSDVPKVFIETGNMRNAADAKRLKSVTFRATVARSLEAGLAKFLGRR